MIVFRIEDNVQNEAEHYIYNYDLYIYPLIIYFEKLNFHTTQIAQQLA